MRGGRFAILVLFPLSLSLPSPAASGWISVKAGPFLVTSQASPKETRQRAAELEQFRFSMGELLGRHDLHLDPPLQVFLLAQPPMETPPAVTRTGAIALLQTAGPLTIETRRAIARALLDQNVGRMPAGLEKGLESFLSTTEVHGAKVTWGTPPPAGQRDADWALVDWLVTNPETYGNMRVLLANLETRVEEGVAYRNALHQSREEVEREVAVYLQAGQFRTIDGPSRPLNPERDLNVRDLAPNDVTLRLADLLDAQAEQRYRSLLNAGAYKTEAEEGLALLALRRNDVTGAAAFLRQAVADGSKNAAALVQYARLEPDSAKAQSALAAAIAADPDNAEAHFLLGQKLSDSTRQVQEWTLAAKLAPRKREYWAALAQALVERKQWVDASKAWAKAEQAATSPAEREQMAAARLKIEQQRMDSEESDKRAQKEAQEREIRRLKDAAIAEIRAAEAKVNGKSSPLASANAIPWDQLDGAENTQLDGELIRVECVNQTKRVIIRSADGSLLKLNASSSKSAVPLTCGTRKAVPVSVSYVARPNARSGVAGDTVALNPR